MQGLPQQRGLWKHNRLGHKKIVAMTKDTGKKEFEIHSTLEKYQKAITYEKTRGLIVKCREIFACDYQVALEAFLKHTT